MKVVVYLIMVVMLASCNVKSSAPSVAKEELITEEVVETFVVREDSINERFLKKAIYDTAVYYNNLPIRDLSYNLNEVYPIYFRGPLKRFFTKEQLKQPIPIKEVTWDYSEDEYITVWYRNKKNVFEPFDTFIYNKDARF